MLAPFNMPRWPLAAPWLLHPSRVAFPGRHSKHWLSNLKCFTSQKLTNTRTHTHTHSHNYNMSRGGSILTGQPGEQLPMLHRGNSSVMSAFPFDTHLPSYPCPPSVPFCFALRLSSHIIMLYFRAFSFIFIKTVVKFTYTAPVPGRLDGFPPGCCLGMLSSFVRLASRGIARRGLHQLRLRVRLLCQSRCYCFQAVACLGSFRSSFSFCALLCFFFLLFEVFTTLPAHNGKQKA